MSGTFFVKAFSNYLFAMLAFSLVSEMNVPVVGSLSGAMPWESCREFLMCEKTVLGKKLEADPH